MRHTLMRRQSPRYCRVVLVNVGTSLHVEVTYSTGTLRQDSNVGVPGSVPGSASAGTPHMGDVFRIRVCPLFRRMLFAEQRLCHPLERL